MRRWLIALAVVAGVAAVAYAQTPSNFEIRLQPWEIDRTFDDLLGTTKWRVHIGGLEKLNVHDDGMLEAPQSLVSGTTLRISGVIEPAQLTVDTNNWEPNGWYPEDPGIWLIDASTTINLTGIKADESVGMVLLVNVGSSTITLVDESASSDAPNRFGFSANHSLASGYSALLVYDTENALWRLAGSAPAGAVGGGASYADVAAASLAGF